MRIVSLLLVCTLAASAQQTATLKDLQPSVVGSGPAVSITEYSVPTPASIPSKITTGPDGALWFSEQHGPKIGRLTTDGVISEFLVPTAPSDPLELTSGPDGTLWFTEYSGGKIGRITTAGVITEFPVPVGHLVGIATGPDGALWFAESSANRIGRITTAGVITEFPVPTLGSQPGGITSGPDGALWFTAAGSNKIGRITTAGVVTEFPVPTVGSYVDWITSGPDGALWFTEFLGNKIGRITTAGVVTEFPVPTGGSLPNGIAAGPDGALWFTEFLGEKIGRITTAGAITEFPLPTDGSEPFGITTGPDGALWFAEFAGDKIGRISGTFPVGSVGQIVSGGTWAMTLNAVNLGNTPAQVRMNFSDNNGNPLVMPLTFPQLPPAAGPELDSTVGRTLNPNAQLMMESTGPDNAATLIGSGQLLSSGIVSGFGIFSNPKQHWNAVVPLETRNASKYILAFDNTAPLTTGVAVANLAAQAANVPMIIRDDTGAQIGNPTIPLSALGHTSFMLSDAQSGFPVTIGKRGSIEFDTPSGGQISVLGLRANGAALTTLPVLASVVTSGGAITHVAYRGGWTSTFYLVNTGDVPAQFTLSFFDENGNALTVPLQLPQLEMSITTAVLAQTLAAGGMLVVNTQAPNELPVVVGSAQLTATGNISGFEIFRWTTFGQEASVPLETRTPNSFVLVFDDTNGLTTGVALANQNAAATNVTALIYDDAGALLQTASINLGSRGHTSFMLPDNYSVTANKRGMVEFVVPPGAKISAIGLRAKNDGTLTTIPVLTK